MLKKKNAPNRGAHLFIGITEDYDFFFDFLFFSLFQRVSAAFLAISDRCSLVSAFALALPPFRPPKRPSATAAGFLPSSGSGSGFSFVASSTMLLAS